MTYTRQLNYLDLVLKNNKVPHAFLFYGPDQPAMKAVAQNFIYRVNASVDNWEAFSTEDELSNKIKTETHPDIFAVKKLEGKREIGIAQIRALRNFLSQSPFSLSTKAAIIEGAESLTEESYNALLKSLEEPAPSNIIFLISSGLVKLPKTIVSRVIAMPFPQTVDKPAPIENDIIRQLRGAPSLSVSDRFQLAEKIAKSENIPEVLNEWLLFLRSSIFNAKSVENAKTALNISSILKTKEIIISTNANSRLMLECLMLKIS